MEVQLHQLSIKVAGIAKNGSIKGQKFKVGILQQHIIVKILDHYYN